MATIAAARWPEMLGGIVGESRRVVAAHSRHFLAISVLFLLPLSSLLLASPSLQSLLSSPQDAHTPPQSLLRSTPDHHCLSIAAAVAGISLVALALMLSAAASIACSVHRGFYGRPVRLLEALRSLPLSLLRLLSTLLSAALLLSVSLTLLSSILLLSLRLIRNTSTHALIYSVFAAIALILVIYLPVNWSLAGVVAILESTWGFKPLSRSAHLIAGMRWAALVLNLLFASGIGLVLWEFNLRLDGDVGSQWTPVVARTVFGLGAVALMLLYFLVSNTVMYLYCKALYGELAGEIAEEFAREYICLPFDERKVPHVVSVVRQDAAGRW